MDNPEHAEDMELLVLVFILLIGPLALLFGADSRLDERARWPEWRRM
ncbi:MAG: hypothetical protein ACRDNE_03865 [Gaiellaceae bacterium]